LVNGYAGGTIDKNFILIDRWINPDIHQKAAHFIQSGRQPSFYNFPVVHDTETKEGTFYCPLFRSGAKIGKGFEITKGVHANLIIDSIPKIFLSLTFAP
jgi:hypothetical protein